MENKTSYTPEQIADVFQLLGMLPGPQKPFIAYLTANAGLAKVVIYDINGKHVETRSIETLKGANTLRIEVAHYAAGMYVISLQSGTEAATAKFVKQQ